MEFLDTGDVVLGDGVGDGATLPQGSDWFLHDLRSYAPLGVVGNDA